jgi:hypothetical protein
LRATPALRGASAFEAPEVFADLSKNLLDATRRTCCSSWRANAA